MKPKRKTKASVSLIQLMAFGMAVLGIPMVIFIPPFGFILLILGAVLFLWASGNSTYYLCPNCNNTLGSASATFCPSCKTSFDGHSGQRAEYAPVARGAHYSGAVKWGKSIMEDLTKYVVVSCQTTGLEDDDEIIEMAVATLGDVILFNERFRPVKHKTMPSEAQAIHGIGMADLKDKPTYDTFTEKLEGIFKDRDILAYNAEFVSNLMEQTAEITGGFFPKKVFFEDVMVPFSQFIGEPKQDEPDQFKLQKLPNKSKSSSQNCYAVISAIKKIAKG